jgi:hypothetical protein
VAFEAREAEEVLVLFRLSASSFDLILECGTDKICFRAHSKAAYSLDSFLAERLE